MDDDAGKINELEERLETLIASTQAQQDSIVSQQAQVKALMDDAAKDRNQLTQTVQQLGEKLSDAQTKSSEINTILGTVIQHGKEVATHLATAESHSQTIGEATNEIADTRTDSQNLKTELTQSSAKYTELVGRIEGILPGATAAGLAKSFEARKDALKNPKRVALALFAISIVGFTALGIWALLGSDIKNLTDFFVFAFERSPFIVGLLLLEEFGRRQYNSTVKLEEDYAYKESISKAFEGYRQEFESMEKPELQQALSERTIETLYERPGRLLDHEAKEKIPAELLSMLSTPDTATGAESSPLLSNLARSLKSKNTRWSVALAASILIAGAAGYYIASTQNASSSTNRQLEIDASEHSSNSQ